MAKCNHKNGYYLRITESFKMYYLSNGTPEGRDNDIMHRGGRVAYCEDCHKNLGAVVTLADGSVVLSEKTKGGK